MRSLPTMKSIYKKFIDKKPINWKSIDRKSMNEKSAPIKSINEKFGKKNNPCLPVVYIYYFPESDALIAPVLSPRHPQAADVHQTRFRSVRVWVSSLFVHAACSLHHVCVCVSVPVASLTSI